jgi:hypothetical protein
MFWPDGEQRRQPGDEQREYAKTGNTVACRWYDRFARPSPCEGVASAFKLVEIRFFTPGSPEPQPIFGAPYRVTIQGQVFTGKAPDAWFRARLAEIPKNCFAEWSLPGDEPLTKDSGAARFSQVVELDFDAGARDEQADKRLLNLGTRRALPGALRFEEVRRDRWSDGAETHRCTRCRGARLDGRLTSPRRMRWQGTRKRPRCRTGANPWRSRP